MEFTRSFILHKNLRKNSPFHFRIYDSNLHTVSRNPEKGNYILTYEGISYMHPHFKTRINVDNKKSSRGLTTISTAICHVSCYKRAFKNTMRIAQTIYVLLHLSPVTESRPYNMTCSIKLTFSYDIPIRMPH